jgi:aminopeptidase N
MSRNLLLSTLVCLAISLTTVQAQRPKLYEEREINSHVDYNDLTKQGVSYRLPNDTFPVRYDISLNTRIDLGVFEFTGNVIIHLQAKEITSMITLHSKMLEIGLITLTDGVTAEEILITGQTLDVPLEFLKISTAVPLTVGKMYVLEINYNGVLRIDNGGFYRSSYVNEQGVQT